MNVQLHNRTVWKNTTTCWVPCRPSYSNFKRNWGDGEFRVSPVYLCPDPTTTGVSPKHRIHIFEFESSGDNNNSDDRLDLLKAGTPSSIEIRPVLCWDGGVPLWKTERIPTYDRSVGILAHLFNDCVLHVFVLYRYLLPKGFNPSSFFILRLKKTKTAEEGLLFSMKFTTCT